MKYNQLLDEIDTAARTINSLTEVLMCALENKDSAPTGEALQWYLMSLSDKAAEILHMVKRGNYGTLSISQGV